jgi:hypothetical protein
MTLLHHFTLEPVDSPSEANDPRLCDLSFLLEHADLADLASLTRRVLELAETSASKPWRPKHMRQWLT